jgi:hypothetical protein
VILGALQCSPAGSVTAALACVFSFVTAASVSFGNQSALLLWIEIMAGLRTRVQPCKMKPPMQLVNTVSNVADQQTQFAAVMLSR